MTPMVRLVAWLLVAVTLPSLASCTASTEPNALPTLHLYGSAYNRGVQHGRAMSSQIRSFYTTMLGTSLLPYLNREQPDIAAFLKAYDPVQHPEYANGQFSLRLLTESAREVEKSIPQPLKDEMRGIADGAGVPYDQVLLLNTFVDSTMGARAVTAYLRQVQSPTVQMVQVLDGAAPTGTGPVSTSAAMSADSVDNDGDGQTDEANEGRQDYAPRPTATWTEVPTTASFRMILQDPDGVDPQSVRVQLVVDGKPQIYTAGHAALTIAPFVQGNGEVAPDLLDVRLTPPQPMPAKSVITLAMQASDKKVLEAPPPAHARTMRIEQLTFSTVGYGQVPSAIANLGASDGTTQPPSIAFAVRGTATTDGKPLLANHFTLLDAGTSHKHCVIQVHHPDDGPAFVLAGWAGLVYGFSGLSARGVSLAVTHADTLNNPLVGNVAKDQLQAKLITRGLPIGFAVRRVLQEAKSTQEAGDLLLAAQHTFGWNVVIADKSGAIARAELHSAVDEAAQPPIVYGPDKLDSLGKRMSSVDKDDVLSSIHFKALADDISLAVLIFTLPPQRFWSSYYYPSVRAFAALSQQVASQYGQLSPVRMQAILRSPNLVDRNDSMQASVIEPAALRFSVAAGQVPATDGEFVSVTLPPWTGP